jgi:hypothetical protein
MQKRFVKEKKPTDCLKQKNDYLERRYPAFGNLVPVMLPLVLLKKDDAGFGVNKTGEAVYLDLLLQFNVTEKNRRIKGLDENDTAVIIKLGTGS